MKHLTICYLGICDMKYSRNKVFSDALRAQGHTILECTSVEKGMSRYIDLYRKHRDLTVPYDIMIVGFPGFVIAPFARLLSSKKVVLDVLSSRYDSDILSRHAHQGNWFKKAKIMFLDWLAFVSAHAILVETEAQREFIAHIFRISKSKIYVVYTGVDETVFKRDSTIMKHPVCTVLFRGRIMNEAGVPTILRAAEVLKNEHIHFDIIGYGWGPWIEEAREIYAKLDHTKVHWDEKEIPLQDIVKRTQQAHVSLGQFGKNERLDRTIPHKAFEAMVMNVPYITGRHGGIAEALQDGQSCIMVDPEQPDKLAEAICKIKQSREFGQSLADQARMEYDHRFSNQAIGRQLNHHIHRIISA